MSILKFLFYLQKKKFEIRTPLHQGKLIFYTSNDEKSKHLLGLCRLTHLRMVEQNQRSLNRGKRFGSN